ncbi:MAG: NAD(P)H-binding protein [Planctomycetota bacterium]
MTQQEPMTVAVAGATGFVGRHVVAELARRGHAVRALVRDTQKAAEVFRGLADDAEITRIQADSIGSESAARLVEGADACVNCIGIIREQDGQRFRALHVAAVDALLKACAAQGAARRFVQISALGVSSDGRAKYQATKAEGERLVRAGTIPWTILRPSAILGDDGELMGQLRGWAKGTEPPFLFMPYFSRRTDGRWTVIPGETEDPKIAPVLVQDVARAVADALENASTEGEVYNLSGSETVSWPELLEAVRDATPGAKKTIKPAGIPAPPAHLAAQVAGFVGLGGLLPFDPGMAAMAAEDSVADLAKFEADFGFTPRSFREAFSHKAAASGAGA